MAEHSAPGGAIASNLMAAANNPVAILTTRLSDLSLDTIVGALGGDRPRASRIRSGEREAAVQELARLIPLCGLKLVPVDKVCVDRKAYEAMSYIASKALANQETAQTLVWDEEEPR